MYSYDAVRKVHLEITTRCNASCPQCPRNIDGGVVNPDLSLTDLSLDEFKTIFPAALLDQLELINFCGNYGDPSVARDLLSICAYVRAQTPRTRLTMHTNGSPRPPEWWAELAALVDHCTFAIDGLEDTNHLYRRNTVWSAIMTNARTYIGAGGAASWDYLVFEHNQHQVDSASSMSRAMGFRNFTAKSSGRFLKDNTLLPSVPVRDHQGVLVNILQPPTRKGLHNPTGKYISKKYAATGAYETYLKSTPITCNAQRNAEIFVTAEGLVFPCCWMAQLVPQGQISRRKQQIHDLIKTLPEGRDSIDARLRPISEILETSLFRRDVPEGWQPGAKRLRVCAKFCGKHGVSSEQQIQPGRGPLQLLSRLM